MKGRGKRESGWKGWKEKCPDPRCEECGGVILYSQRYGKLMMRRISGKSVCVPCHDEIRRKIINTNSSKYVVSLLEHFGIVDPLAVKRILKKYGRSMAI